MLQPKSLKSRKTTASRTSIWNTWKNILEFRNFKICRLIFSLWFYALFLARNMETRFKVRFKYDIALTFNWHFYLWTDLQPSPFFRHPECYTSCYTLAIQRPCIFWALAEIIHIKYNGVTQFTTKPLSKVMTCQAVLRLFSP